MKKAFAFILTLFMMLSLCACIANNTENPTESEPDTEPSTNVFMPTVSDYIGTWKHDKTDDAPITMNFTLNEDGTGNRHTYPINWSMNTDGSITISVNYGAAKEPEITTAVLLEDGTLQWNKAITVKAEDGTSYKLEYLIMKKS